MRWYNWTAGVWQKDPNHHYWWESANMMSGLASLSMLDSDYNGTYFDVYANTFLLAGSSSGHLNFQDEYYDDEGWWALAWLDVYDLCQNPAYLEMSISLFNDIHASWPTNCGGGGVYWTKARTYIASIANGTLPVPSTSLGDS